MTNHALVTDPLLSKGRSRFRDLRPRALLVAAAMIPGVHTPRIPTRDAAAIDSMMVALHHRGQFDGEVLVARLDTIVYRRAFGDARPGVRFSTGTPSCLGSVSKQFTAMAIMMLAEEGKLRYDDPASRFLPDFAHYAPGVTIRHLLTHTSGIPDYGSLNVDRPGLTNGDVWRAVQTHPPLFAPGQRYEYSNTGYVLLAMIVERVAAQPFAAFLEQRIFAPLGMRHTFVLTDLRQKTRDVATAYDLFGNPDDYDELVAGDNGMYSSVDDLRRWDLALRHNRLVPAGRLAEAFTPARPTEGSSTYGFGWNVTTVDHDVRVWHTGNTSGFRAFIELGLRSGTTVILLTNNGNTNRVAINAAIQHILVGEPYTLPKRSVARRMHEIIRGDGVKVAVRFYRSLRAAGDTSYDTSEGELNVLGYQLLDGDKAPRDAISIFALNVSEHPSSSNAYDSLAEAYVRAGNRERGMENYRRALELDRGNVHAATMLKELGRSAPARGAPRRD